MSETLRTENHGPVRLLVLSRGRANPLTADFCEEIHRAARAAEEDPSVRGVVLTSASPSIFCGGFDLGTLTHADRRPSAGSSGPSRRSSSTSSSWGSPSWPPSRGMPWRGAPSSRGRPTSGSRPPGPGRSASRR